MKLLVTGVAGFIGSAFAHRVLREGHEVVGVDNLNDYYDVRLKEARLARLKEFGAFEFVKLELAGKDGVASMFEEHHFEKVMHLAAQAGVRYSLENPHAYIEANITAFLNILEGCRHQKVKHLVYASSSSVYGLNQKMPFNVHDGAVHPKSLYAATKKSNELMAHTYSELFGLPTTGLRFFTVYGPWGRPDMALFLFTKAILEGRPIDVFNHGNCERDFTYVDDIVEGLVRITNGVPTKANPNWDPIHPDPATSCAPYRVYNIGNNNKVNLLRYVEAIENCVGIKAEKNLLPLQPGDVVSTYANVDDLAQDYGYRPNTEVEVGVKNFVDWYRSFYGV